MNNINKEIDNDYNYLLNLRRYFHAHPEVALKEYETAKKIECELDLIGVRHQRIGETGVLGIIEGKQKGKTILLRSDIDALPIKEETNLEYKSLNEGVMHACGHDIHITSLIGAARYLVKHKDEFKGTVLLVFQQAEEIGFGAQEFIKAGVANNVDRAIAFHIAPEVNVGDIVIKSGPIRSSVDYLRIEIRGKSSHIATPESGVDATLIAAKTLVKLNDSSLFEAFNKDNFLLGFGSLHSGTSYNIVSDNAYIEGTLRAFDESDRKNIKELIDKIIKEIASSFNAEAKLITKDFTSVCINDINVCNELISSSKNVLIDEHIIADYPSAFIGDDFAEFTKLIPGVYILLGTKNDTNKATDCPLHNPLLEVDEESILVASKIYVNYSLDYLK